MFRVKEISDRLNMPVGQADHNGLYAKGIHGDTNAEPEEVRKVYFMGKWMKTSIYNRSLLKSGNSFAGPAIIEDTGATSVIGPGDVVTVDERLNLIVKVADNAACQAAVEAGR